MRHSTIINALFGSSRFRFLLAVLTGFTVSSACFAQDAPEMRLTAVTGPLTPEQRNVHSLFAWGDEQVLFSAGPDFIPGESYLTDGASFEPVDLPPDQARGFFWDASVSGSVTPDNQQVPSRYFVVKRSTVTVVNETLDGTHLVKPLFDEPDFNKFRNIAKGIFDGFFYFTSGTILYRTNGNEVFEVGELGPDRNVAEGVYGFTQREDAIYFLQNRITLRKTDGTSIEEIDIAPATNLLGPPIAKDDTVYFAATGSDGNKIYALDEAGAVSAVVDFPAERIEYGTQNDDALYFTGSTGSFERQLYYFDGANLTTVTGDDVGLSAFAALAGRPLMRVDGHLYFMGNPGGVRGQTTLYRLDGTTPVAVYGPFPEERRLCAAIDGSQTIYLFIDRLPYAFDTQTQTTTALSDTLIRNDNTATEACPAVVVGDRLFMISGNDLYATERCPGGTVGDANLDGEVTFADFLIFSANFNQSGGWQRGDFDCDNLVGFSDFLMLSANYGVTSDMGTGAQVENVPEPSEWVNVMVAVLAFGGLGRHRRLTSDP